MPTPTYVALAKTVLTSSQSTITFSAIPQTYTDLLLVCSGRSDRAFSNDSTKIEINGSSAAEYSPTRLLNTSNVVSSSSTTGQAFWAIFHTSAANNTANTFGSTEIYLPNYTGSTYKVGSSVSVQEDNSANGFSSVNAHLWSNTAAITSLKITPGTGPNWVSGSRFDLYGIKNS